MSQVSKTGCGEPRGGRALRVFPRLAPTGHVGREGMMLPRGKLDIGWADLGVAARACLQMGDRGAAQRRVAAAWSDAGEALACLSVRSGFDLLLQALALPAGSEILVSAITIRD